MPKNKKKKSRRNKSIDSPKQLNDDAVKAKLADAIEKRPAKDDLIQKNIMKSYQVPADPKLHSVLRQVESKRAEDKLKSLLEKRSTAKDLQRKNILLNSPNDANVYMVQKELQKKKDMDRLNLFLGSRPSFEDIVSQNIVEDTMTWTREITSGITPLPRNCHSMTSIGSSLFLIGGFGTNARSIEIMQLDLNQQLWSRPVVGGMVPIERYSHTTVAVGSQLLVFGGFTETQSAWLNDLQVLDTSFVQAFYPALGRMKKKSKAQNLLMWYEPEVTGEPPCPRAAHSAVVVDAKMYIFAGNDGSRFFNDMYVLDTNEMEWSKVEQKGDIPTPRAGHSACLVGEETDPKLAVFGGGGVDGPLHDLYIFNFATSTWIRPACKGTPPSARAGHTACRAFTSCILVFGGGFRDKVFNDLHMFDVETSSWSRPSDTGTLPVPRTGHTCNMMNNRLYVFGGGDYENVFNDLHSLDTAFLHLGSMRRRSSLRDKGKKKKRRHSHTESSDDHCSNCDNMSVAMSQFMEHAKTIMSKAEELIRNVTNKEHERQSKLRSLIESLEDDRHQSEISELTDELANLKILMDTKLTLPGLKPSIDRKISSESSSSGATRTSSNGKECMPNNRIVPPPPPKQPPKQPEKQSAKQKMKQSKSNGKQNNNSKTNNNNNNSDVQNGERTINTHDKPNENSKQVASPSEDSDSLAEAKSRSYKDILLAK